jgi:hypothetical protein
VKSLSTALPPLSKVAAALGKTTEVLAHELAAPTSELPAWTEFEWQIARAVAAMHGVSSLLYRRLRWEGPESWQRFLQEQNDHSISRYRHITRVLQSIDLQARVEGIGIVALKGAALATELYAAGERPMGDIDLLGRADEGKAIARALERCDYTAAFATLRHQVFQPRIRNVTTLGRLGEHIDNPIKIELHTKLAEQLPVIAVDITQFVSPRTAHAGINPYPSTASLMLHLLLHAAGNIRARALRLIQLHDIALLAARFSSVDWEELLAARTDGQGLWWALAPLMLTARYYPATMPAGLFERLSVDCPWLLKRRSRNYRLADVSWSKIRIEAFPGVEWSKSPREALEFMSSRIWPSRQARLELKEGADQIPESDTIPWYGISHGARIPRWVFSNPPRVQTLLPVRAALAQHYDESAPGVAENSSPGDE